ncbi:hypothetical protein DFJ63DRAFT_248859 [Scheffersomyces coipomensis]|uniref:uncharacterized protein n=1 Tax=Scheffersomyces coipomensis TaxID=1788519 RepID=UPI00315DDD5F
MCPVLLEGGKLDDVSYEATYDYENETSYGESEEYEDEINEEYTSTDTAKSFLNSITIATTTPRTLEVTEDIIVDEVIERNSLYEFEAGDDNYIYIGEKISEYLKERLYKYQESKTLWEAPPKIPSMGQKNNTDYFMKSSKSSSEPWSRSCYGYEMIIYSLSVDKFDKTCLPTLFKRYDIKLKIYEHKLIKRREANDKVNESAVSLEICSPNSTHENSKVDNFLMEHDIDPSSKQDSLNACHETLDTTENNDHKILDINTLVDDEEDSRSSFSFDLLQDPTTNSTLNLVERKLTNSDFSLKSHSTTSDEDSYLKLKSRRWFHRRRHIPKSKSLWSFGFSHRKDLHDTLWNHPELDFIEVQG